MQADNANRQSTTKCIKWSRINNFFVYAPRLFVMTRKLYPILKPKTHVQSKSIKADDPVVLLPQTFRRR